MFTGIIQGLGTVKNFSNGVLKFSTDIDLSDCKIGSSISCNGVCLTIINIDKKDKEFILTVNIGEETISRTIFSNYKFSLSNKINIEKSLKLGDEIAGHFVYGHVDLTTKIVNIIKLEKSWEFILKKDIRDQFKFIVEKASVAINGISLTIAKVKDNSFAISVIPHTYLNTNLHLSKINDLVNVEFDYLARFQQNKL
ncbi:MAG: Riboflavin synthase [Alphaproteobacteria bacterium MarineAlpha5_Bin5]|nr:MAG: Riboflavin synthase [Alphaproteobacteria bacterium MarineAlpha5_Bin5]PPR52314.1 MAG: Riboflavin synthase [Alphaproteobacteria bacterium MarineAlpha5_Bin4]|tara:strand:+ start:5131 stop:5721 length:591 start_codon:yes stop_codon:yes gene_type:complete